MRNRQIHLDFHTSPFIPDIAADFDPDTFARQMAEAKVNSVTVFAKCHHGMSYYPTKVGTVHPHLRRPDLLGDMIEALHRRDIAAPVYTTVVWEENVAQLHPEWRQMKADGTFCQLETSADMVTKQPAGWRFNNFLHPDYQDYFSAHLDELLAYPLDGLFVDILWVHPEGGWSETSRAFRKKHDLLSSDAATQVRFNSLAQQAFIERFSAQIRGKKPQATIFYNAPNDFSTGGKTGPRPRQSGQTHNEVESLPSGFWGYHHFERTARAVCHWSKPWLAMTGRFQKMWGDFGGVKPTPALEFECFRAQALGGGCSIGDQMHPRGTLDAEAYARIRHCYGAVETAEAFYETASTYAQVGIVHAFSPGEDEDDAAKSEEGALLLCQAANLEARMLDAADDPSGLELVILPDQVCVTPELAEKLQRYWEQGGKLLISGTSGLAPDGSPTLDFLPYRQLGTETIHPTYWRSANETTLPIRDRVMYQAGMRVEKHSGAHVLIERVLPYFQRTDLKFCSHFHAPPKPEADAHPAVLSGERFLYCADPVFSEYRTSGNTAVAEAFPAFLEQMDVRALIAPTLSRTMYTSLARRGDDLLVTLLHYIPVRKAHDIDVIDERSSFAGQHLQFYHKTEAPRVWPTGEPLSASGENRYALPNEQGRLLLSVPGFFRG